LYNNILRVSPITVNMEHFVLDQKELEYHVGEIMCSICLDVQVDPHISTKCFHSFCKKCITKWRNSGKNTCPECRASPLTLLEDLRTKRIINQLEVKCKHCKKIGKYDNGKWMHKHLLNECETYTNCGICKNNLVYICIVCEVNYTFSESAECKIAFGECGHIFHKHCIDSLLKYKKVCPIGNKKWIFMTKKLPFAPIKKIKLPNALQKMNLVVDKVIARNKKLDHCEILKKSKQRWKSIYTTNEKSLKYMIDQQYLKFNNDGSYSHIY